MKRTIILSTAVLLLGTVSESWGQSHHHGKCEKELCSPTLTTKKVKKRLYEAKCTKICIPRFRWPWEKCGSEVGKARVVKKLVVRIRTTEKPVLNWKSPATCEPCTMSGPAPDCPPTTGHPAATYYPVSPASAHPRIRIPLGQQGMTIPGQSSGYAIPSRNASYQIPPR